MIDKIDFSKGSFLEISREIAKHYVIEKKENEFYFKLRSGEGKAISRTEFEKIISEKLSNYRQFPEKEPESKAIRIASIVKYIIDMVINILGFIRDTRDNNRKDKQ
jgi:hypothetical protein